MQVLQRRLPPEALTVQDPAMYVVRRADTARLLSLVLTYASGCRQTEVPAVLAACLKRCHVVTLLLLLDTDSDPSR